MPFRFMADAVVVIHLLTVGFVIAGGALVVRWQRVAWFHLPIVIWVIFAECFQKLCPLTVLENWLRDRGSMDRYQGDFVAHYLLPVLYPDGLTSTMQIAIGIGVLVVNLALYFVAFRKKRETKGAQRDVTDPMKTRA